MRTSTTEDDVRRMLARRAADVGPSPDAWDAITARLDSAPGATDGPLRAHPGRGRRVLAGAAVAAVAVAAAGGAALVTSAGPGPALLATAPDDPAALAPTGAPAGTPLPGVWPRPTAEALTELAATDPTLADPVAATRAYLHDRLAPDGGGDPGIELAPFRGGGDGDGRVAYTTAAGAGGDVLLHRLGGEGGPWYVVAAATEVLVFEPLVVDGQVTLRVTPEDTGSLSHEVTAPDGTVLLGGSAPVEARRVAVLGRLEREGPVTVRARLEGDGGALLAHLEVWSEPNPLGPGDPGDPSFPGIWPVDDPAALAALEADVADGRAEVPDAEDLAVAFLADELGLAVADTDGLTAAGPLEGQVAFRTEDGAEGTVLLAREGDGDGRAWYVTEVRSERLAVVGVRPEGDVLVVDVEAGAAGLLTGVADSPDGPDAEAVPQSLERPLTTSLGFAGVTGHTVVVVRLAAEDGAASVAVVRV